MSSHQRVIKNTLFLYVRMFITILVSLYTTRVVLSTLGVSDYGIYNVIAGFVSMFSFLTTTMSSASTRFFSFELGNDNIVSQKKTFQITQTIYIIFIGVVLLIGETLGLWFVIYKLNIPQNSYFAAIIVYQISLLTLIFNILRIPYNAAIIAHERMKFYAYISIIEAVLKLIIVFLLVVIKWNKLILYAVLLSVITFLVSFSYYLYAIRNFKECISKLSFDRDKFKEILSFSGWNLTSNLGDVLMDQGLNILLNIFFGPIVNAARGIAYSVKGVVTGFVGNFQMAASPQITKHYANQEFIPMKTLVIQTSKISFYLMLIIVTPIFFCINPLLRLWLTRVPEYTNIFIIIILIEVLVLAMGGTLNIAIQASGRISKFVISLSIIKLINFGLVFIGFKYCKFPPQYALWICIVNSACCMIVKFFFCKIVLSCSFQNLMQLILKREILTVFSAGLLIYLISLFCFIPEKITSEILMSVVSFIIVIIFSFYIGLNKQEQTKILRVIKNRLSK